MSECPYCSEDLKTIHGQPTCVNPDCLAYMEVMTDFVDRYSRG